MKRTCYFLIGLMVACWNFTAFAQVWTPKASFPGTARDGAIVFSIGSNIYYGGGFGTAASNDFYQYNTTTDTWTKKSNLPNTTLNRGFGVGLSVGNKGYFGLGLDNETLMGDFWEYDPAADKWTQLPDYPGGARDGLVSFVIGSKIYIGAGSSTDNPYTNDFWQYDPVKKEWSELARLPISSTFLSSFVIGNYGYVTCGSGMGKNGEITDLYRYDASKDEWQKMEHFPGTARQAAVAFTSNGLGYVGLGQSANENDYQDFYAYDPTSNTWSQVLETSPITSRAWASAVNVNDKVFIGGGGDINGSDLNLLTDWWELVPATAAVHKAQPAMASELSIYPNPARTTAMVQAPAVKKEALLTIVDAAGHEMLSTQLTNGVLGETLNLSSLPTGEYFLKLQSDKVLVKKLIKN